MSILTFHHIRFFSRKLNSKICFHMYYIFYPHLDYIDRLNILILEFNCSFFSCGESYFFEKNTFIQYKNSHKNQFMEYKLSTHVNRWTSSTNWNCTLLHYLTKKMQYLFVFSWEYHSEKVILRGQWCIQTIRHFDCSWNFWNVFWTFLRVY